MDYHNIVSSNINNKISVEIDFYTKEHECYIPYIEYLKKRIDYDNINENLVNNLDFFNSDTIVNNFSMKWNSMKKIPQRLKLKEYVDNLSYSNKISEENIASNKKLILDKLYLFLENKQIQEITNTKTKPKSDKMHIKYSIQKQKITEILFIKKNTNGLYSII